MPDPNLSSAIKEAYATVPVSTIIYHTLEIWNSAFSDPIRVVLAKNSINAKLESSSPRNAGATVTFTPMSFEIIPPNQDAQEIPSCTIRMDNVDRIIGASLDTAVMSGTPTTVIYRQYMSDALSAGPETDPGLEMTILGVELTALTVTAKCGFPNLLNRIFPYGEFDLERFPGLAV